MVTRDETVQEVRVMYNPRALTPLLFVIWVFASMSHAVSAEMSQDEVGKRMNALFKSAPYLVKIYTPDGGNGSGFLYRDRSGRWGIYTNNHVVKNTTRVRVFFNHIKTDYEVFVLSRDVVLDVALLGVPTPLPRGVESANLGFSSSVEVGDAVYAIGYPYGRRVVTFGRVTGEFPPPLGPLVRMLSFTFFPVQTPVYPGSSGGPLISFNEDGKPVIVGMNSMITTVSVMTLAKNVNALKNVMSRLWTESIVEHATLGVLMENAGLLNPFEVESATKMPYSSDSGNDVVIVSVLRNSVAQKAGMRPGDIITGFKYDDTDIPFRSARELNEFIFYNLRPGMTVVVNTRRGSQTFKREITLEALQPPPEPTGGR